MIRSYDSINQDQLKKMIRTYEKKSIDYDQKETKN